MDYIKECQACNEVREYVDDRLFELRSKSKRSTPEQKSLSHIEHIFHQIEEIDYKITIK